MTQQQLSKIYDEALYYCFKRIQHDRIRKAVWRKAAGITEYPSVIIERLNIPNIGSSICEYILYAKPKAGAPFNINADFHIDDALYIPTDKCYSGIKNGGITSSNGRFFIALHSHAVDRYIERHHFNGDFKEAEEYILLNYKQVSYKMDMTTNEIICPFNSGAFLGYEDEERTVHLKTFVMNRQLYQNQRLDEVKAKQFEEHILRGRRQ